MAIFQSIKLSWGGKEYTLPADRVLGAISVIEEVATFTQVTAMLSTAPNMSKLARAYGALLRFAGASVDDEQIYEGMFRRGETHKQVATALNLLLNIMMPPSSVAGAASEGNAQPSRARSSKRSTKRRSAAAG